MTLALVRRRSPRPPGRRGISKGVAAVAVAAMMLGPLGATGLVAQAPRWEVDLSGARIGYDTMPALNAPSLTGLGEWRHPQLFARLAGGITGFQDAGWSAQLRGDVARWFAPSSSGPLRIEVAGSGSASRHSRDFHARVVRADARVHLLGSGFGAWLGGGVSSARNSFDSASVGGVIPGLGLWAQDGPLRATFSYFRTRVDGQAYPEVNMAVSLSRGAADVTAYGGFRRPQGDGVPDDTWAGVTAALWVHPSAALLVSGGGYASDLLQGLPGGEYLSVGIRLTPQRARPIPASAAAPIVYSVAESRSGEIGFGVDDAESVEIAGDWNGWVPEPLERGSSGRWLVPPGLAPGVYRFNLRVDEERWIVPEGVPEIEDGFGGRVGLLIIAEAR